MATLVFDRLTQNWLFLIANQSEVVDSDPVHLQWRHCFLGDGDALAVLTALPAFSEQCFKTFEKLFFYHVAIGPLRLLQLLQQFRPYLCQLTALPS